MKFTIVQSTTTVSKKFSIDKNGELTKNDGGNLRKAKFATASEFNISDLKDYIESKECTDKTIFIPGTSIYDNGLLMTKALIKKHELEDVGVNKISRTKKDFDYRGGGGFLLIDYDPSPDYVLNDGDPLSKDELLNILYDILPEIKDAPHLWKTSSSSCIESTDTMEELRGINGQHIFIHVKDNTDIERTVEIFYKRLWLAGHGYIFVDKTGGMHNRTIIDKVVNSPEREVFLKADCMPPAYQNVLTESFNEDSVCLDTRLIPDLDIDEEERFDQLIDNARDKRAKLASSIRGKYVKKNHEKLGLTQSKLDNCIVNKILYSDNIVILNNGVRYTVSELYEKSNETNNEYCHDPLEPDYGGSTSSSTKGWIDLDNSRIHSHAHGGMTYVLEHSKRKKPIELALEVCDLDDHHIMFRTAANEAINMRYLPTEIDQFIGLLAKHANMKKGSCEKAFKDEYNRLRGTTDKVGSVDIEAKSIALDDNGDFIDDYIQNDLSKPVNIQFPHTQLRGETRQNLNTLENFEFMTKGYGIKFMYDVILKAQEIIFPIGAVSEGDNRMNACITRLKSLCSLNKLGRESVDYVVHMVNNNQINPVLSWVESMPWDGNPRIRLIADNIKIASYGSNDDESINKDFSERYKHKVMRMWLMQCMAALDGSKRSPLSHMAGVAVPKYEYILVFVGSQGVQKTKFIKSLLPNNLKQYILTGHELDTKDKDSIKIAISHWITELGELDSTFKKSDISSLKAFMSKEDDEIRLPYAAAENKFVRRTSFCGSVNDIQFLVDKTGNRRYLPMETIALNPLNTIDVPLSSEMEESGATPYKMSDDYQNQQLWAEVLHYYLEGEQWWPDESLDGMLDIVVRGHQRADPIVDALESKFNLHWNDVRCNDIKIRKNEAFTDIGEKLDFIILKPSEVCKEVDLNTDDRTVGLVSNYLTAKGFRDKQRKYNGVNTRGFRLCILKGAQLNSKFVVPIINNEEKNDE